MIDDLLYLIKILVAFLPFALFAFFNSKANMKKKVRYKQYYMPFAALLYCIVLYVFMEKLSGYCAKFFLKAVDLLNRFNFSEAADFIQSLYTKYAVLVIVILFNTLALIIYVILKRFATLIFKSKSIDPESFKGQLIGCFYSFEEDDDAWYVKPHFGQARTFLKTVYYGGLVLIALFMLLSFSLFRRGLIAAPFYPVFAVIIIGEVMYFTDGLCKDEKESDMRFSADRSTRIALYPLLRTPLRTLFGDKLSSEGTTVNNGGINEGSVENILVDMADNGGHVGKNYAAFIRMKMLGGLKPNVDYLRCGYDLSVGKSLLFNTPFYYKLVPYVFYAMNRALIKGEKVLIILGSHGTADDLRNWCEKGMMEISNTPDLWNIDQLCKKENEMMDIGIITRSGVHDLDIHKANLSFLKRVSFVMIIEPSKLVATAQIGLNLLIKCCGRDREITYCSVDRNCDGLVDSLSHILMTSITEVSATEYPHGMSTYMCWTPDKDHLQHRIVPGISRDLGMGTELSFAALNNQVRDTIWYGGESFPVLDIHWIAKQYYHDLLNYAKLPATQESFDKYFKTHFNMCDEQAKEYAFISVEDDRNNAFETKRVFATIAEKQGFINVISREYMLREYMTQNTELFNVDPKAIPYFSADYARTKRNVVLTICLNLCVTGVNEKELCRELLLIGIDSKDPGTDFWREVSLLFCNANDMATDKNGNTIISVLDKNSGKEFLFEKDATLCYVRRYSVDSGVFESIYSIENERFANIILDDLRNAKYIAEETEKDSFIGTELKGHIYQKYLPGQFFTLGGKYYEMVSVTNDNRILMRRASEHINGRLSYRQVRNYCIDRIENSKLMGDLKTVNGIDIYHQYADFRVNTPAYWKMNAYNDFNSGELTEINGVPERSYFNKQVLKLDFSKFGEAFTESVRTTLTVMLNEVFVTLFADNRPFISAVTPGEHAIPQTYSLEFGEGVSWSEKCIYIIEDSQLDIGLLVTVERNINRFLQIIADYLLWNEEMMDKSFALPEDSAETEEKKETLEEAVSKLSTNKKKGLFARAWMRIRSLFHKKTKKEIDKQEKKGKKQEKKLKKEERKKAKALAKETKKQEKEAKKLAKKAGDLRVNEQPNTEEGTFSDNEAQDEYGYNPAQDGESVSEETSEETNPQQETEDSPKDLESDYEPFVTTNDTEEDAINEEETQVEEDVDDHEE